MDLQNQFGNMVMQMLKPYGSRENAIKQMRQQAGNNPVLNNALDLFEKGDYDALNRVWTNIQRERNVDPNTIMQNMFIKRFPR